MIAASLPGAGAPGSALLAVSTVRAVGTVVAVLALIGLAGYLIANFLSSRAEVGSEVELAPNRKPYLDDEHLEGRKLTHTLFSGMALLALIAVAIPAYWLAEPGRQEGAVDGYLDTFEARGLEQYEEGSQCANCHGAEGVGGQAPFTILDDTGNFVAQVNWRAPALNTVLLRFSRDEVIDIIDLGRPGTPMPAWGEGGGGPRSEQEIENIVDYLAEITLDPEVAQLEMVTELALELEAVDEEYLAGISDDPPEDQLEQLLDRVDWEDLDTGEAAFNLGQDSGFAGGAYACARCHTRGWSIITTGEGAVQPTGADIADYVDYDPGAGALGPPLDTLIPRQFASVDSLAEFISAGSDVGVGYGDGSASGSGRMPGFGDNPNTTEVLGDGMLPREVICAIARYESTLRGDQPAVDEVPTTTTTTSTTTTTQPDAEATEQQEEEAAPAPGFCDLDAIEEAEQAEEGE